MPAQLNIPAQAPEFADPIEIVEGVLWARLPLPYQLDHVNIYFINEGDGWAILDAGINHPNCIAAWERMLAGPLKGFKFNRLIVTHYHPDHMGLARWLCEKLDLPLYMGRSEYLFGQFLSHVSAGAANAHHRAHYSRHAMSDEQQDALLNHGHSYLKLISGLPDSYNPLRATEHLQLGSRQGTILTGGGHSPEQIMLHLPQERIFFAADQVIERISPNVSVLASEPDANPLGEFIYSLHELAEKIPQGTLTLSGHRMPILDVQGRISELIAHHKERCSFILDILQKGPQSITSLTPKLFTRPLDPHQFSFAFAETAAHVNYLLYSGALVMHDEAGKRLYHLKS